MYNLVPIETFQQITTALNKEFICFKFKWGTDHKFIDDCCAIYNTELANSGKYFVLVYNNGHFCHRITDANNLQKSEIVKTYSLKEIDVNYIIDDVIRDINTSLTISVPDDNTNFLAYTISTLLGHKLVFKDVSDGVVTYTANSNINSPDNSNIKLVIEVLRSPNGDVNFSTSLEVKSAINYTRYFSKVIKDQKDLISLANNYYADYLNRMNKRMDDLRSAMNDCERVLNLSQKSKLYSICNGIFGEDLISVENICEPYTSIKLFVDGQKKQVITHYDLKKYAIQTNNENLLQHLKRGGFPEHTSIATYGDRSTARWLSG